MTSGQAGKQDAILVGTAVEIITPKVGAKLSGYPNERISDGVALDLCARAAVFAEVGQDTPAAALVVLDTIGVTADLVAEMRKRAAAALPGLKPETLMVAATHTHSAARLYSWTKKDDNGPDSDYVQSVVDVVAKVVPAAWEARRAVTMRVGRGEVKLGHCRRVVDAEGQATNEWLDVDGLHTGYFNPDLRFVVFDDAESGKPRVIVDEYGCHPVTMGPPNLKISPDYPGYLVRALEKATGAETAIHITAGAGNINPRDCLSGDPATSAAMAQTMADEIVAELNNTRPAAASPVLSVSVPLKLVLGPKAGDRHQDRAEQGPDGPYVTSEVQAIRIGDVAIVSAPGELFAEIATTMRNRSPFKYTVVASCTNDSLGYLSTDTAQREGGYEARRAISDHIEQPLVDAAREAVIAAYNASA